MKLVIFGTAILIIGIGTIRYSSILGAIIAIIGLSIMMKSKNNIDNK